MDPSNIYNNMNIKQSKPKGLISTISVEVVKQDYHEKVEEILKDYRKKVQVPGFRKGKTPMSIISKKYRTSIVVDEVNKLIQDKLYNYITSEKLKVLGSPLPLEDNDIDWGNDNFIFNYEIGLAPDFDINITSKDKLDYYNIKADAQLIKNYSNDIAKRHGKMTNPNVSKEGDLVFCEICQLDSQGQKMQDGIKNDATVSMDHISNKKIKKQFIGLKVGDELKLNVMKAFSNHHDLSAMLNIKHDKLHNLESEDFSFIVKNVNRLEPAELNSELFDKVYGKGIVKNIKEFKSKIKEEAEGQFVIESDRMLKNDVVVYLIDKLKLKMPDDFLKKWLIKTSEQPITMEMLDSDYPIYVKSLQWQLIENKILQKHEIQVTEEEALDHTKKLVTTQMRQYGQLDSNIDQLEDIAQNILKNQEEKKKIYDQIFDQKTLSIYKENFKLNKKSISYNDFIKLATEKNKKQ